MAFESFEGLSALQVPHPKRLVEGSGDGAPAVHYRHRSDLIRVSFEGANQCAARLGQTPCPRPKPYTLSLVPCVFNQCLKTLLIPAFQATEELRGKLHSILGENMRREPKSIPYQTKLLVFSNKGLIVRN